MTSAGPAQQNRAHRIALLFNANKVYDREIIEGIGTYLRSTRVAWDLFLEEDFRVRLSGLADCSVDGFIADFDDPAVRDALAGAKVPVVAVGGSHADASDYPAGVPYVATDNVGLVRLAHDHLIEAGLQSLALYSLPESAAQRWAREREQAFGWLAPDAEVYRGMHTSAVDWSAALDRLTGWIHALPKPVGIVAITDARARHLLQACALAGIAVPEEVAIVGIDNDPLAQSLTRIGLSSVCHGTHQMGRMAARTLHRMLGGARLAGTRLVVPPSGVNVQASSKHTRPFGSSVTKARYYIRQYACQGIKNEQVAGYVGVSRSTLESSFRREVGTTLHQELLWQRIDAARRLLRDSDLPATAIAERCGFTTVQYMHVVFKRELATTPAAYRREARQRAVAAEQKTPSAAADFAIGSARRGCQHAAWVIDARMRRASPASS